MFLAKFRVAVLLLPAALALGSAGVVALARPDGATVPARRPAPPPPEAKADQDPAWTVGPPVRGEPAWKTEFRTTYALADGQAVKLVPGPFPDSRAECVIRGRAGDDAELTPERRANIDQELLRLESDGRRITIRSFYSGAYGWRKEQTRRGVEKVLRGKPLWNLVEDTFGLVPPLLEATDDLMKTEVHADVVVREGAKLPAVAASLQAELRAKFDLAVTVTAREEEREVIVAKGKYVHKPRDGRLNCVVDISAEPLPEGDDAHGKVGMNAGGGIGDLFRRLGWHVDRPVLDEVDPASWKLRTGKDRSAWKGYMGCRWPRRGVFDIRPADGSGDRDAVLKRVADQTGLTFTAEKRKVWVLAVTKDEK
jgi:hypothetical protein